MIFLLVGEKTQHFFKHFMDDFFILFFYSLQFLINKASIKNRGAKSLMKMRQSFKIP